MVMNAINTVMRMAWILCVHGEVGRSDAEHVGMDV